MEQLTRKEIVNHVIIIVIIIAHKFISAAHFNFAVCDWCSKSEEKKNDHKNEIGKTRADSRINYVRYLYLHTHNRKLICAVHGEIRTCKARITHKTFPIESVRKKSIAFDLIDLKMMSKFVNGEEHTHGIQVQCKMISLDGLIAQILAEL